MTSKPWRVDYDLAYDVWGSGPWHSYYRTKFGAQISRLWNVYVASWGGSSRLSRRG